MVNNNNNKAANKETGQMAKATKLYSERRQSDLFDFFGFRAEVEVSDDEFGCLAGVVMGRNPRGIVVEGTEPTASRTTVPWEVVERSMVKFS